MVNFENGGGGDILDAPFFQAIVKEENGDEDFDVCLNRPGKKRRLTGSQVQFLERNFEVENKLEPERKIQLAKELGLQPRQVAIWFQNRRARFKNKQLEKDYDALKTSYDRLKDDYDNLLKEKENLKMEVKSLFLQEISTICLCIIHLSNDLVSSVEFQQLVSLKAKLLAREEGIENLEHIEAINSPNEEHGNPVSKTVPGVISNATLLATPKREEASSAGSDVFDSDSPHSFLEPGDSSHVFEPDQSDFSQEEEDDLSRSFMPTPYFPKLYHDTPSNSCSFEFPVEDQPFWTWTY